MSRYPQKGDLGSDNSPSWLDGVVFVTGNRQKLIEARRLCGFDLASVEVELPEIQSLDILKVLSYKADEATRHVTGPFIVEETGLELDAMNGFPGALVKWMLDSIGVEAIARIVESLGNDRATARCGLLLRDGDRLVIAEGSTSGRLVLPARGENGFGWDPVFIPDGETRTYAELCPSDKDRLSHRGRAWQQLSRELTSAQRDTAS
jgi:XTP/dITP diphosphohydrolase